MSKTNQDLINKESLLDAITKIHMQSKGMSDFYNKLGDSDLVKEIIENQKFKDEYNKPYKLRVTYQRLEKALEKIQKLYDNIDVKELDLDSPCIDILNELNNILKTIKQSKVNKNEFS